MYLCIFFLYVTITTIIIKSFSCKKKGGKPKAAVREGWRFMSLSSCSSVKYLPALCSGLPILFISSASSHVRKKLLEKT